MPRLIAFSHGFSDGIVVFSIKPRFPTRGTWTVVCSFNNQKVYAEDNGYENQRRDTKCGFERDVLNDCACDNLTR